MCEEEDSHTRLLKLIVEQTMYIVYCACSNFLEKMQRLVAAALAIIQENKLIMH